jgi:hypothetical protein
LITDTSNVISARVNAHDTNFTNTSNWVSDTSNVISDRITSLNADSIANGTTNKFIVNNEYNTDFIVKGTLTASNLNITGTTTTINTTTYQTENMEIVTAATDAPAFTITQSGTGVNDVMKATYNTDSLLVLKSTGSLGVGVTNPTDKLEVNGTTKSTIFSGSGSGLTSVNLSDRTTTNLAEGTNLYYTAERVGVIATSSNLDTSNYIAGTSNVISTRVNALDTSLTNNTNLITDTSNVISARVNAHDTNFTNTSNWVTGTSNVISARINAHDTNFTNTSNWVTGTSNVISARVNAHDTNFTNTSNWITGTSNVISARVNAHDSNFTNTSNWISDTSNIISARMNSYESNSSSTNNSNMIIDTSNVISSRVNDHDTNFTNTSNWVSDVQTNVIDSISIWNQDITTTSTYDISNVSFKYSINTAGNFFRVFDVSVRVLGDESMSILVYSLTMVATYNSSKQFVSVSYMVNTSYFTLGTITNIANGISMNGNTIVFSGNNLVITPDIGYSISILSR